MHRPYPALSLRSSQRSWQLTREMHFVCEPAPACVAPPSKRYLIGKMPMPRG